MGSGGINVSTAQFVNMGMIEIDVSGLGNDGLTITNLGHFTNHGNIDITASAEARGIVMSSSLSAMEVVAGSVIIQLSNTNGIDVLAGELTIASGATLSVSGTVADFRLDIDVGAELDCQGVLDLH